MIAIVAETAEEKIQWNKTAIELAEHSQIVRARAWLGSLHHNMGQAYLEAKQYENALQTFQKTLSFREEEGYEPNVRVAKWGIARALRLLDRTEESLSILLPLINEYDSMTISGKLDMPEEMIPSVRGLVYEELAEIYVTMSKTFSKKAYGDLSKDEWFKKLEPERLEHLKQQQE